MTCLTSSAPTQPQVRTVALGDDRLCGRPRQARQSQRTLVEVGPNGELIIYVREPAIDGKANDAVTRLLAAHLQLPKSRVKLVSGATSRFKRFRLSR